MCANSAVVKASQRVNNPATCSMLALGFLCVSELEKEGPRGSVDSYSVSLAQPADCFAINSRPPPAGKSEGQLTLRNQRGWIQTLSARDALRVCLELRTPNKKTSNNSSLAHWPSVRAETSNSNSFCRYVLAQRKRLVDCTAATIGVFAHSLDHLTDTQRPRLLHGKRSVSAEEGK